MRRAASLRIVPLAAMLTALAASGCMSLTDDGSSDALNMPVVGVTSRSVGFTVQARSFSFEQRYAGPTVGDSIAVGLTVVNYAAGTVLIEIVDSTGALRLQQTVSQNIAQGNTTCHGVPPYALHLLFTGFSGTFSLGVGAQN